jgi:hypothetical protein
MESFLHPVSLPFQCPFQICFVRLTKKKALIVERKEETAPGQSVSLQSTFDRLCVETGIDLFGFMGLPPPPSSPLDAVLIYHLWTNGAIFPQAKQEYALGNQSVSWSFFDLLSIYAIALLSQTHEE